MPVISPVGDLLLDLLRRLDVRRVRVRAERAEPDSVLIEAEDRVAATLEGAVLSGLRRQEDGAVDALQRTRQHVRAEERLVGVDADAPDLLLLRREERAEAAAARDLEDAFDPAAIWFERELLALRLVVPVLRVPPLTIVPGTAAVAPALYPGDVTVDGRLLEPGDGADRVSCRRASPRSAAR